MGFLGLAAPFSTSNKSVAVPPNGSTPKWQQLAISRHASPRGGSLFYFCSVSPLFKIARVLVRFDHVARFIVNANHGSTSAIQSDSLFTGCRPAIGEK